MPPRWLCHSGEPQAPRPAPLRSRWSCHWAASDSLVLGLGVRALPGNRPARRRPATPVPVPILTWIGRQCGELWRRRATRSACDIVSQTMVRSTTSEVGGRMGWPHKRAVTTRGNTEQRTATCLGGRARGRFGRAIYSFDLIIMSKPMPHRRASAATARVSLPALRP